MNTRDQLEEYLLGQVESDQPDMKSILGKLVALERAGKRDEAIGLAEFVETAFREKKKVDEALKILRLRAEWMPSMEFRKPCASAVLKILSNTVSVRAFIKNCGLDGRVPLSECLNRLDRLRHMQEGTLCCDKTWGFGVIQNVDPYEEKLVVDFERRPNHPMAMRHAAESLELIGPDHIMAVRHTDPERLETLIRDDPAEVVRMVLRSYGPLSSAIVQEKLSPIVVPSEQWKKFWDAARKALKADPDAMVPTKRNEPILLKNSSGVYDDTWFQHLKNDRDVEVILSKINDWITVEDPQQADPLHFSVIENRMAFVIKGADLMGKTVLPRAMILARAIGGETDIMGVKPYVEGVLTGDNLLKTLDAMSAKDMKAFVAFLLEVDREATLETLVRLLHGFDVTSLTEIMHLLREGEEERCRQAIKGLMNSRRAQAEVLCWISRNMEKLKEWDLCSLSEFSEVMVLEMEKDYAGSRLKAQNQLRSRFTQKSWVKHLFDGLGEEGRERFFLRLKDSSAWPTMEKRSTLGQIIKLYPEMERLMSAKAGDAEETPSPRGLITSGRSYRERQLLAERIKLVDIPNNSKEIAVARAHGDLRENFEYQAAKDAQGLLMRRQAELQQMLAQVVPTDFDTMPYEKVGPGTGVVLEYTDGRQERFYILGVWDRDEALGVISCESKMAQALDGAVPDQHVRVPTETGEASCRIVAVEPLSDEVRTWIRNIPEKLDESGVVSG